jgi:hypothetical protein
VKRAFPSRRPWMPTFVVKWIEEPDARSYAFIPGTFPKLFKKCTAASTTRGPPSCRVTRSVSRAGPKCSALPSTARRRSPVLGWRSFTSSAISLMPNSCPWDCQRLHSTRFDNVHARRKSDSAPGAPVDDTSPTPAPPSQLAQVTPPLCRIRKTKLVTWHSMVLRCTT